MGWDDLGFWWLCMLAFGWDLSLPVDNMSSFWYFIQFHVSVVVIRERKNFVLVNNSKCAPLFQYHIMCISLIRVCSFRLVQLYENVQIVGSDILLQRQLVAKKISKSNCWFSLIFWVSRFQWNIKLFKWLAPDLGDYMISQYALEMKS